MTTYDPILDTEVDAESPITESLMTRLRDNLAAVAEGDTTVPTLKRILVPTALRTSEVDTSANLVPDGVGGVRWSSGGFGGSDIDGTGLGTPVADLSTPGVYHFVDLTISVAQAPTGPITIYCSGDILATASITSAYAVKIYCSGDITLGVVTCTQLIVKCGGSLQLGGNITASTDLTLYSAGTYSDGGYSIVAPDIYAFFGGNATIAGAMNAYWTSGGAIEVNGTSYGNANGGQGGASGFNLAAAGGGGGTGGGHGGDAAVKLGGLGDSWRGGHNIFLLISSILYRGGGGGGGYSTGPGGDGGGRISVYVAGNLTATGGVITASGLSGSGATSGAGAGGGGGYVRVVCAGNIAGGTVTANGGNSSGSNGNIGCGGGGSALVLASGYSGTQTVSASIGGGRTNNAQGGTTSTSTFTAAQIQLLAASGIFNV